MPATADSKLAPRHTIKVIPPENLPAHLRHSQQHCHTLLSAESSPLLSPPPPYRQYEQDTECALDTLQLSGTPIIDNDSILPASAEMNTDVSYICDRNTTCCSCSNPAGLGPSHSPSASTPIHYMRKVGNDLQHSCRPRRHSSSVSSETPKTSPLNSEDYDSQALDRISVILSHLLKEASDAVNSADSRNKILTSISPSDNHGSANSSSTKSYDTTDSSRSLSSPKRSKIQFLAQTPEPPQLIYQKSLLKSKAPHRRANSELHCDPNEESSSTVSAKRRSTGSIAKSRWPRGAGAKDPIQKVSTIPRSGNSASLSKSIPNRSCNSQPNSPKQTRGPRRRRLLNEPLLESYRRVDNSLALVESLSRDLASNPITTEFESQPQESKRAVNQGPGEGNTLIIDDKYQSMSLVAFLMVQAIHSVLAFCSELLSFKSTGPDLQALESSAFYNALSWAFTYTMGNVLVDQCIQKAPARMTSRVTIPGEYKSRSPSPVLLNQMQSYEPLKQQRNSHLKATGFQQRFWHTDGSGVDRLIPSSSQSLSLLERRGVGRNNQGKDLRNSDKMIEKLLLRSPTRGLYNMYVDVATEDESDEEQEVLEVLAVKRIKKRSSVKYNGIPILERRHST